MLYNIHTISLRHSAVFKISWRYRKISCVNRDACASDYRDCYKHGKSLPRNVSLMVAKRVYRGKYEMTDSSHVWTPVLGDKFGDFGDEIWDLKGAGIFSISLLAEVIRLNVLEDSM
ncbi:hypothetical protein AVEN_258202-1 [Araneus ventricosus]|uniref:Uncharacterized protein n=1 Tax=Araneus ventricosus TaxID=182803 RepID=A0A4Y2T730_ARAVE|nr:hypothetical protein AVEN_258202-1 [Araneus ventricosus]